MNKAQEAELVEFLQSLNQNKMACFLKATAEALIARISDAELVRLIAGLRTVNQSPITVVYCLRVACLYEDPLLAMNGIVDAAKQFGINLTKARGLLRRSRSQRTKEGIALPNSILEVLLQPEPQRDARWLHETGELVSRQRTKKH